MVRKLPVWKGWKGEFALIETKIADEAKRVGPCVKCGAGLYFVGLVRLTPYDEWREVYICSSCEYAIAKYKDITVPHPKSNSAAFRN